MEKLTKRDLVFIILTGIFVTNAVLAEIIGGKLIQVGPFAMSIGVIPWPIVFLTTDLINEFYGKEGVRRITFLTAGLIIYAFIILFASMLIPSAPFSPVQDAQFDSVFGQSLWIIAGSILAFLLSQLIDVTIFLTIKSKTKDKLLWMRSTGSTILSQFVDSLMIIGIAFWLPGKISTADFFNVALNNYAYKLIIAIALTPFIYIFHKIIKDFISK